MFKASLKNLCGSRLLERLELFERLERELIVSGLPGLKSCGGNHPQSGRGDRL
jgi:hypothetical protein